MTDDETSVFSSVLVSDLRDANLTPDFPRTGEITRAMVKKGLDEDVDGVISVDPVAMSFILAGTGPVTLDGGGVLTQENAVAVLLNAVYVSYQDNERQDEIFQQAARKIFDVVKSGRGESRLAITGWSRPRAENRLTVWSSHDEEQRLIAALGDLRGDEGRRRRDAACRALLQRCGVDQDGVLPRLRDPGHRPVAASTATSRRS